MTDMIVTAFQLRYGDVTIFCTRMSKQEEAWKLSGHIRGYETRSSTIKTHIEIEDLPDEASARQIGAELATIVARLSDVMDEFHKVVKETQQWALYTTRNGWEAGLELIDAVNYLREVGDG